MREDIRTFALDRIKQVVSLDKHFLPRKDFSPDKYMKQCWKQYAFGEPIEIVIRFSPRAVPLIKRKKWHASQEITEHPDGYLDMKVTVSGTEEIMRWILTWGCNAEVISPKSLRQQIKTEAQNLLSLYSSKK